jgi:hypothetical protein
MLWEYRYARAAYEDAREYEAMGYKTETAEYDANVYGEHQDAITFKIWLQNYEYY